LFLPGAADKGSDMGLLDQQGEKKDVTVVGALALRWVRPQKAILRFSRVTNENTTFRAGTCTLVYLIWVGTRGIGDEPCYVNTEWGERKSPPGGSTADHKLEEKRLRA